MWDWHGLRIAVGALRHLRMEGRRRGQQAFGERVCVGLGDAGADRGVARADGTAARMIEGHLGGILAHWTQGLTTAFMEGLNSLFSAVKRKALGYRSVEHTTTTLYFVAGKLILPCY